MFRFAIVILLITFIGLSCRPPVFPPKPAGYFKIDTPATHQYRLFDREGFPYSFEYPVYSSISDDTVFQSKGEHNPYWINMFFPSLGGVINITFKEISPAHPYLTLVAEADNLVNSHEIKADGIALNAFNMPGHNVSGILYAVGGNAATSYQFTATDSVKHFIRGALYFDVTPNSDSLKPANDFLARDIKHMLETLRWK